MNNLQAERNYSRSLGIPVRPQRVAIVLNGNARAVNENLIRELAEIVQDETLFVSRSAEQSKFIARTIVNKGYDVVFCGGGDGTFSQCVSDILDLHPANPPAFGILPLGTGNALAKALCASVPDMPGLAADLHLSQRPDARIDLPLLRIDGRLAPFAGLGLDAFILRDYQGLNAQMKKTPMAALAKGLMGYAFSISTRSVWRFLIQPEQRVIIRNEGAPACRINAQGKTIGAPMPRGEILYKGPMAIAAASTIPFYGFGLCLFPQAMLRRDRFQLRVGSIDTLSLLANIPHLFRGDFQDHRIHDYFCTAISIYLEKPIGFQIGGDDLGQRKMLRIELTSVKAVGRVAQSLHLDSSSR